MSELMITGPTEELRLWEKVRNTRGAADDDVRTRQTMLQRALRHCCPTLGAGECASTPALDQQRPYGRLSLGQAP